MISWSAIRQETVSSSSTEAEYRSLSTTARKITWLSFLPRDLVVQQLGPTSLKCDNLSAVYLSANPALHKQSKNFLNDYHYIREQVALGLIETKHVPAAEQIADIFTKSLPRKAFIYLRDKLGVGYLPTPRLRGNMNNNVMGLSVLSPSSDNKVPGPAIAPLQLDNRTKQSKPDSVRQGPLKKTLHIQR